LALMSIEGVEDVASSQIPYFHSSIVGRTQKVLSILMERDRVN
jgi:hypothetical protein